MKKEAGDMSVVIAMLSWILGALGTRCLFPFGESPAAPAVTVITFACAIVMAMVMGNIVMSTWKDVR